MFGRPYLIHYGEIALKKGNRGRFVEHLLKNIRLAFKPHAVRVRSRRGRIFLHAGAVSSKAVETRLGKVFGIANYSPAIVVGLNIDEAKAAAIEIAKGCQFESFGIRPRRPNKSFGISSQEIAVELGRAVGEASGRRVDLSRPDLMIGVEVLEDGIVVHGNRIKGAGGLPLGTAGGVVCLLSGGIDSPVAAWRMMKRGCHPTFIHFHSAPFVSISSVDKAMAIAGVLAKFQHPMKVVTVPFGNVQQKIVSMCPPDHRIIFYRRFMLRIAERLVHESGAMALVTGEALAQVSSQTLPNMAVIDEAANVPVLRPLVGLDKDEITNEARRIGTFDLSIQPHDDCCSFLTPSRPITRARIENVKDVEADMPVEELVNEAWNNREEDRP